MNNAPLYLADSYLRRAEATVLSHTPEGGIVLDTPLFYPTGGGQPGDSGRLEWAGGTTLIATTVKGAERAPVLVPAAPDPLPPPGTRLVQEIDWARRFAHMRMHTALHLLSVVIPLPVTGGQVGAEKGRLDFDMPHAPEEVGLLEEQLNRLIARDLAVTEEWITDAALAANPGLVKTMSVAPPTGQGRVRLIRIGAGSDTVDLQPCGGTHVARTGQIGRVAIGKIENKGRQNRRVSLLFAS